MHRLFQTLVVCGAGLGIVQCGGKSTSDGDEPDLGRGGTDPSSGGAPVAGGGASSGNSSGESGDSAVGGSNAGGTQTGSAGEGNDGKPNSPTEQWVCNTSTSYCDWGSGPAGVVLEHSFCAAEPERPATEADCAPGTQLACLTGLLSNEVVRFNCECLGPPAGQPNQCSCPLPRMDDGCIYYAPPTECQESSLCACTTCILR